jgi:spore coat protein U-like protein
MGWHAQEEELANIDRLKNVAAMASIVAALGCAGTAHANTAGATMGVSATDLSLCTVVAGTLAFGNYQSTAISASTTLTVLCTATTPYTISLGGGSTNGGTQSARLLYNTLAATTLAYSLYEDSGHVTPWTTNTVAGTGTGLTQTINVYGGIAGGLYAAPGAYSDSVAVTLTY